MPILHVLYVLLCLVFPAFDRLHSRDNGDVLRLRRKRRSRDEMFRIDEEVKQLYIAGKSHQEIADACGTPRTLVRNHLYRLAKRGELSQRTISEAGRKRLERPGEHEERSKAQYKAWETRRHKMHQQGDIFPSPEQ